jgi:uncharacterized membrane protein YqiK
MQSILPSERLIDIAVVVLLTAIIVIWLILPIPLAVMLWIRW